MNSKGFSLIECMLYCAIVAVIMLLWFNGVASFIRTCTTQANQINSLSAVYSALDVLVRDIRKAPNLASAWPLITDSIFVFEEFHDSPESPTQTNSSSIGWEYKDKQLLRYQGNYKSNKQEWTKRAKSLVLSDVETCSFSFNLVNQTMVAVTIIMVVQGEKIERTGYILST